MNARKPLAKPLAPLMVAAAAVAVTPGAFPGTTIQLLKMGRNTLRDGRGAFILRDLAHAEEVVAATRAYAGGAAIPVDYDHQSIFAAREGVGGQALAAGWIEPEKLTATAEGIFAEVEWTPAAAERLKAREYRYLSPVVLRDEGTHAVIRLANAALTNTPAITDLLAVASTQETRMDMTAIAAALGLPETATAEEIVAAIAAMKEAAMTPAMAEEKIAASVAPVKAELETVTAALADATRQLAAIQAKEAERIVAAACEAGKITPAQKPFWLGRMAADHAGTAAYLETAPAIVKPGELVPAAAQGGGDALTEVEIATAKRLGLTPEKFKTAKGA